MWVVVRSSDTATALSCFIRAVEKHVDGGLKDLNDHRGAQPHRHDDTVGGKQIL